MAKVRFNYNEVKVNLSNRTVLKAFIEALFKNEKKQLKAIDFIFCSDDFLLDINRVALNHDYYTDIITFDLSSSTATESEIYISVDRVKDNAIKLGTSFTNELHRVIFHGCLHLCSYKDKTNKDIVAMRAAEDKYLNLYFK